MYMYILKYYQAKFLMKGKWLPIPERFFMIRLVSASRPSSVTEKIIGALILGDIIAYLSHRNQRKENNFYGEIFPLKYFNE